MIRWTDGSQVWTFLSFHIACWNWKVIPTAISVPNSLVSVEISGKLLAFHFFLSHDFFPCRGTWGCFSGKIAMLQPGFLSRLDKRRLGWDGRRELGVE